MTEGQQATGNKLTVTAPADREIHAERVFDADRERVFNAFIDPEQAAQWYGPRGTETIIDKLEATPGGAWRFVSRNADGTETAFRGTFREITPPERIVQTFEWDGMPGYVAVDTAVSEDLGDGRTKLVTTSIFHTTEERDGMLASGMETGMGESYDRLEELLAAG